MDDGNDARMDPKPAEPLFRPVLVEDGPDGGTVIRIMRHGPGSLIGETHEGAVAILPFVSHAEAIARLEWMGTRKDRWTVWGRMAPILGASALAEFIDGDAVREAVLLAKPEAETEARKTRTNIVRVACGEIRGRSVITLRRGDEVEPVLKMHFLSKIERDRVWDWVRWQTDGYADWHATCLNGGALSVERTILDGMIREEKRVKTAGLSAGGRRPLRFWRGQDHEGCADGWG